jgi:hypothetical protein
MRTATLLVGLSKALGSDIDCDRSRCTFPGCIWSNTGCEGQPQWESVTDLGRLEILVAAALIAIKHGDHGALEAAIYLSNVPAPALRH